MTGRKAKITTKVSFERSIQVYHAKIADKTSDVHVQPFVESLSSTSHSASETQYKPEKRRLLKGLSISSASITTSIKSEKHPPSMADDQSVDFSQISETDYNPQKRSSFTPSMISKGLDDDNASALLGTDHSSEKEVETKEKYEGPDAFIRLPTRPWNWEEDAFRLEQLDGEKELSNHEMELIQARAIAPMDCEAVYSALARIHAKLNQSSQNPKKVTSSVQPKAKFLLEEAHEAIDRPEEEINQYLASSSFMRANSS